MKKNIRISPIGLKGNAINERMKELMGISLIKEGKSGPVIELTKRGPDGNAYAVVRENHEWYIKKTFKKTNLVAEDFQYIGGLANKKDEAYPSYAKAIKQLNLKFRSLAEAYNYTGVINITENDNLLSEDITGFSTQSGNGFTGENNFEKPVEEAIEEDEELSEEEKAIDDMMTETDEEPVEEKAKVEENKLTIGRALENMDAIIDSLTEAPIKKKVYHIR